jgi:large subunit ribosomal protein L5
LAARLKEKYTNEVFLALKDKFKYANVMEIPKLEKITLNMGLGDTKDNPKLLEKAVKEMTLIAGQAPVVTKSRKSIANFKLREGMSVGSKVTLRGERMYEFADKFFAIALPRVRDFKGVGINSFDGRGNYAFGIKEQMIFPEIEYDKVDKARGMDIIIVTNAKNDNESKALLELLGLCFEKNQKEV